uniref:Uncharacterized protein n=1 Tax=viral metagenome TaxID=1070528 RepID=A0A6C0BA07_9ZZZZ
MSLTLENKKEARIAIDTFFQAFEITCKQSRGGKKGRVKKGGMDSELLKIIESIGYKSLPWLILGGILILEYLLSAYISSTPDNDMFQVIGQDYSLAARGADVIQGINSSKFLGTGLISYFLTEMGVQCSSPRAQAIIHFMRLISSCYSGNANQRDLLDLMNIVTVTISPAALITGGLMGTVNHLRNADFETLKQQAFKFSSDILAREDEVIPESVPTHAPVQHGMSPSTLDEMDYYELHPVDSVGNATNYSSGGYRRRRSKGRRVSKKRTKTKGKTRKNKRRKINDKKL